MAFCGVHSDMPPPSKSRGGNPMPVQSRPARIPAPAGLNFAHPSSCVSASATATARGPGTHVVGGTERRCWGRECNAPGPCSSAFSGVRAGRLPGLLITRRARRRTNASGTCSRRECGSNMVATAAKWLFPRSFSTRRRWFQSSGSGVC